MDAESEKRQPQLLAASLPPPRGFPAGLSRSTAKRFGVIPGVTDREYYTNSLPHPGLLSDISAFEKIRLEAPYHALTNGGHITYVELDGDPLPESRGL